jgi:hypothetical protein
MKHLILLGTFLLFSGSVFSQTLKITADKKNLQLKLGDTALIKVKITAEQFSKQLFFKTEPTDFSEFASVTFPVNPVSAPYPDVTCKIVVKDGIPGGQYKLIITAYNGPLTATDTCIISVSESSCGWEEHGKTLHALYKIAIDNSDVKWILRGSSELIRYDEINGYQTIDLFKDLSSNSMTLTSIAISQNNIKWIGTGGSGLLKYNGQKSTLYNHTNSPIPSDWIYDIVSDKSGTVWMATMNGVANFDGNFWEVYNKSNSMVQVDQINAVTSDRNGNIWICDNLYVYKVSGTNWTKYNREYFCSTLETYEDVAVDSSGTLYLSDYRGNIIRIKDDIIDFWGKSSGVPDESSYRKIERNGCTTLTENSSSINPFTSSVDLTAVTDGIWVNGKTIFGNYSQYIVRLTDKMSVYHNSKSDLPLYAYAGVATDKKGKPYFSAWDMVANQGTIVSRTCKEDIITGIDDSNLNAADNDLNADEKVTFYPNPASDLLTYRINTGEDPIDISVFDISGRKMEIETFDGQMQFSKEGTLKITNLVQGIYFLNIRSGNNTETFRFSKL